MPTAINIMNTSTPAFLMNVPFSLVGDVPNNVWMEELSDEDRSVNSQVALSQFHTLYRYMAQSSIVYLLPSRPGLQDQTFVSNLAVVLPHCPDSTVVVSRFRSQPRVGEDEVGIEFFRTMEFSVHAPPVELVGAGQTAPPGQAGPAGDLRNEEQDGPLVFFEGEADLKYLRDNIYFGGHGIRSNPNGLHWLADEFAMEVIPVHMTDPRLFHLDCLILPISGDTVVVCTELIEDETLRRIEKLADVIPISQEEAHAGASNCVLLGNEILYASDIDSLSRTHYEYRNEVMLNQRLETICKQLGKEPRRFDLSEFYKNGGGLACMVMHLNYANRD